MRPDKPPEEIKPDQPAQRMKPERIQDRFLDAADSFAANLSALVQLIVSFVRGLRKLFGSSDNDRS